MPDDIRTRIDPNLIPTRRAGIGGNFDFTDFTNIPAAAAPVRFDIETPASPVITRGGQELPTFQFDPTVLDDFYEIPRKQEQPRVVAQSPVAGTRLPRGATVDLVITAAAEIPFDIFDNPHLGFKNKKVGDLDDFLDNPRVTDLLKKYGSGATPTGDDRTFLVGELQKKGIAVDDADPQRSFDRALRTAREASAFR